MIINCGFSKKVTCTFLLRENIQELLEFNNFKIRKNQICFGHKDFFQILTYTPIEDPSVQGLNSLDSDNPGVYIGNPTQISEPGPP